MNFYLSLFPGSRITQMARYGEAGPGVKGSVMSIGFELDGREFAALNGGPVFHFNEAVSFLIWCDTQAEIDRLWDKLVAGGTVLACGWVKDRFGLAWQINYAGLRDMLASPDAAAADRAMQAMMTMQKIDIATIDRAYRG